MERVKTADLIIFSTQVFYKLHIVASEVLRRIQTHTRTNLEIQNGAFLLEEEHELFFFLGRWRAREDIYW